MSTSLWLPAPTRGIGGGKSSRENTVSAGSAGSTGSSNDIASTDDNGAFNREGGKNRSTSTALVVGNRNNRTESASKDVKQKQKKAPSYEERCASARRVAKDPKNVQLRKSLFVPRSIADFDDGGAFPEIHVAQYPRNMGNPHLKSSKVPAGTKGTASSASQSQLLNVEIDADGKVNYDAIVTQGTHANNKLKVYTRHSDLRGGEASKEDIALPTEEEERAATERTQAALQSLLSSKISAARPKGSALENAETSMHQELKTQFIHYTPNPNAPGYNAATAPQRVIQMVPAQVDPMMPPKHKHKKEPRGPAEDPVPVLHAPPKKLTKEEAAEWNVPACVSNWKNTRGYTIPLDKRLAADGRGVRDNTTINPKFATLSESLYVAERQAREEVRMRANVQHRLEQQQKQAREEELRKLAMKARLERSGGGATSNISPDEPDSNVGESSELRKQGDENDDDITPPASDAEESGAGGEMRTAHRRHKYHAASTDEEDNNNSESDGESDDDEKETDEQREARQQRDRLRLERKRERERELRQEKLKKPKTGALDEDRDISEKIALGIHTGSGGGGNGVGGEIDTRLYNQSAGFSSGFGPEDEYNAYDKPLFDRGAAAQSIYKPTIDPNAVDIDTQLDDLKSGQQKRFAPSKGFAGAEGPVSSSSRAQARNAPVQFEKGK